VTLSVAEYAKRRFVVLGQVQRPGPYELPGDKPTSLLQAIAIAGGYTRIGSPRKVTVQRLVDGDQRIFKLDAEAMAKESNARMFEILPEDTITVGEKLF
jgi:polysaccharide export outer membrane protein